MLRVCIVIRMADRTSQWAFICLTEMFMGLGNMHSEIAIKIKKNHFERPMIEQQIQIFFLI